MRLLAGLACQVRPSVKMKTRGMVGSWHSSSKSGLQPATGTCGRNVHRRYVIPGTPSLSSVPASCGISCTATPRSRSAAANASRKRNSRALSRVGAGMSATERNCSGCHGVPDSSPVPADSTSARMCSARTRDVLSTIHGGVNGNRHSWQASRFSAAQVQLRSTLRALLSSCWTRSGRARSAR